MKNLVKSAKSYSRTILGLISLMVIQTYAYVFLAIVYGQNLSELNKTLLFLFAVLFPFFLFGGLLWIIAKHPILIMDVRNYKNEEVYLRVIKILASANLKNKQNDEFQTEEKKRANVDTFVRTVMDYAEQNIDASRYILWVDDNPNNNVYERIALEQLGWKFVLATSTKEALLHINQRDYAAIISDMSRMEGTDEGYVLLRQLRNKNISTPYIIYTSSATLSERHEAICRGAMALTDNMEELINMVMTRIN